MPAQLVAELVAPCQLKMVKTNRKGRTCMDLKVRGGKLNNTHSCTNLIPRLSPYCSAGP